MTALSEALGPARLMAKGPNAALKAHGLGAADIARSLADHILALVVDLLPSGHREGHEWVCPAAASPFGCSISVHLTGSKAGVWSAWSADRDGDALDLVVGCLGVSIASAMAWSRKWLGVDQGEAAVPRRPMESLCKEPEPDPDRWRYPWQSACPIRDTLAETYLANRHLRFDDADGRVLRFTARRGRKSPAGDREHPPALLCALSDAISGEQVGIINIYLNPDGRDRLRDSKGKTVCGRARNADVMLSDFDEPTGGLVVCEGCETGIALYQCEFRPVWACGSASTLAKFPVLAGVESLTIATDADVAGQRAAGELAKRWREGGREVFIIRPRVGDWGDHR